MQSLWNRLLGVALLPLLILWGHAGTGGWFCADGSRCGSDFAATCCCGSTQSAPADDCCATETGSGSSSIKGPRCGCYYDAGAALSLLEGGRPFAIAPALLPVSAQAAEPPSRSADLLPSASPGPPPRFPVSPGDSRAPPAA
jgi:hypothetical protein